MTLKQLTKDFYVFTDFSPEDKTQIILLHLFPGIILGINDIHTRHIHFHIDELSPAVTKQFLSAFDYLEHYQSLPFFRVNYCMEGRCEVKLANEKYVYVDSNLLCVEDQPPQYHFYYPLGVYKGIELHIDKEQLSQMPLESFQMFGIDIQKICSNYLDSDSFICQASDLFASACIEIISIWENECLSPENKVHELRLLICRLLYYLTTGQASTDSVCQINFLTQGQYNIVYDCEKRLTADLSRRRSIEEMAKDYKISPSSLKNYFRQVYGSSISQYVQAKRMEKASVLLNEGHCSVMEIAEHVGYENQSKFSAAFKKYTGYAPLEYKKINTVKEKGEKK